MTDHWEPSSVIQNGNTDLLFHFPYSFALSRLPSRQIQEGNFASWIPGCVPGSIRNFERLISDLPMLQINSSRAKFLQLLDIAILQKHRLNWCVTFHKWRKSHRYCQIAREFALFFWKCAFFWEKLTIVSLSLLSVNESVTAHCQFSKQQQNKM